MSEKTEEVEKMDKAKKPAKKTPAKEVTPPKKTKFAVAGNRGNTPLGR